MSFRWLFYPLCPNRGNGPQRFHPAIPTRSDNGHYVNLVEVRFVDQKPTLNKVWGIGPERKSSDARELENLIPVSV
jgi:hypothetical protein